MFSTLFSSRISYVSRPKTLFVQRRLVKQNLATMSFQFKPNTEPPKDMTVFKNISAVASTSGKFRRVLWTGRNSQASQFLFYLS